MAFLIASGSCLLLFINAVRTKRGEAVMIAAALGAIFFAALAAAELWS